MGCLSVDIRPLRKNIEVHFGLPEKMSVEFDRKKNPITVNVGMLCSVGVGRWEYLACSDLGYISTYDRGFIIVPKR